MKESIDWLIKIEDTSARIYEKAAAQFLDDKEFADFLMHLAKEEKQHYNHLCKAYELIKDKHDLNVIVSLDKDAAQEIEDYLLSIEKKTDDGILTKDDMISCVVSVEYSEWNHLFLYVMNTLRHDFKEFIPVAAEIHNHKKHIEHFLESHPEYKRYLKDMRGLIDIWKEKFLVVDDDVAIVDLLDALLADEGNVKKASNGEEALKMVGDEYFAAIITDVDMPLMNGIEFYNKAVEMFPNIKDRFLFFTGSLDDERESFFRENNLRYLTKPATITEVKNAVAGILYR
jgi:CheY-like chemotaxis protein